MKTAAQKKAQSKWQQSEAYRKYQREYRERPENKARIKVYQRSKYLDRAWGLTPEEYDNMLTQQDGACAICRRHQTEFKIRLAVDHCHATGKVRGLLCTACNHALGKFEDSTERLVEAIKYLARK